MNPFTATRRDFLRASALAAITPPPAAIYTFDAAPLRQAPPRTAWDAMHVLAALQGLANRDAPRLYLFYCTHEGRETDRFWFEWLRHEDGWLARAAVTPLRDLRHALATFRHAYAGLAVYDAAVPATSNAASTAAGAERLLPVRYDPAPGSVYTLLAEELRIPVKLRLVGKSKVETVRASVERYLRTGRSDPRVLAYYIDAFWLQCASAAGADMHTLSNHDYFIARRAFFFDLSPWDDEAPNDDPSQSPGADRAEFLHVLRAAYEKSGGAILKVGGFPPWPFKYTDAKGVGGKHGGVPTEWEFGRLISQFNGYMEADAAGLAAMANASFYRHYPLAPRYPQPNPKPTLAEWKARGFVTSEGKVAPKTFVGHYAGDYDAPSWLYKSVPSLFTDPARGDVPIAWAFDPNLADRAPQAFAYAYRHAGPHDYFIAGDSGAGYLNPRALTVRPDSGLPPALDLWAEHCRAAYSRWDMTITGFLLDGSAGRSTDVEFVAYRRFSPNGLGTHFERDAAVRAGVPTCPERDLPNDVAQAADAIARDASHGAEPAFQWRRSVLRKPAWYAGLSKTLRERHATADIEVVDPYTFFGLIAIARR